MRETIWYEGQSVQGTCGTKHAFEVPIPHEECGDLCCFPFFRAATEVPPSCAGSCSDQDVPSERGLLPAMVHAALLPSLPLPVKIMVLKPPKKPCNTQEMMFKHLKSNRNRGFRKGNLSSVQEL